ncbi:MAG: hypothetical protein RL607_453 [Bacteroidota bacterium]|jgi:hypothetical protein
MIIRSLLFLLLFIQSPLWAQQALLEDGTYQLLIDGPEDENNATLKITISGNRCVFDNGSLPIETTIHWLPNQCFSIPGYTEPLATEQVPESVKNSPQPHIKLLKKDGSGWLFQIEIPGDSLPICKGKIIKK